AGLKVLVSLGEVPEQLVKANRRQLMNRIHDQDRSRELIRQVEDLVSGVDILAKTDPPQAKADLQKAEAAIDQIFGLLPNDPRTLVVKGKIMRRKATLDVDGEAPRW